MVIEPEQILAMFNGKSVSFVEGFLNLHCEATLQCTVWGVSVHLVPDTAHPPFTVDGAWEILSLDDGRLNAAHVGWSISLSNRVD